MSKIKKNNWPTTNKLRQLLFLMWSVLFIVYISIFLSLSAIKADSITFEQASNAAWNIAYLMIPVLGAFAGYWFNDNNNDDNEKKRISPQRFQMAIILTIILHVIVFLYIVFGVIIVDYKNTDPATGGGQSFENNVANIMKVLLLIWSVSLAPVQWLLKGQKIPDPSSGPRSK